MDGSDAMFDCHKNGPRNSKYDPNFQILSSFVLSGVVYSTWSTG